MSAASQLNMELSMSLEPLIEATEVLISEIERELKKSPGVSEVHADNVSKKNVASYVMVLEVRGRLKVGTASATVHFRERFDSRQCRPLKLGPNELERSLRETPFYTRAMEISEFFHQHGQRTRERVRED